MEICWLVEMWALKNMRDMVAYGRYSMIAYGRYCFLWEILYDGLWEIWWLMGDTV